MRKSFYFSLLFAEISDCMRTFSLKSYLTFFLALGGFVSTTSVVAQDNYSIKFDLEGLEDSVAYLAVRNGMKHNLFDTAVVQPGGQINFSKDRPIPQGVYSLVSEKKAVYFEFLVDGPDFTIKGNPKNKFADLTFKGSPENDAFFEYQRFMQDQGKQMTDANKKLEALEDKESAEAKTIKAKQEKIRKSIKEKRRTLIAKNPAGINAVLLRAQLELDIPKAVKADKTENYLFQKKHHFDNVDFKDDRLVRSPLYHIKLSTYFERMIVQHYDSVNKEIDYIFNLVGDDKEYFKYTFVYLYNRYNSDEEVQKIMGIDGVFVHLVKNYYTKDKAFWASDKLIKQINDRANELDPILIGKKAPNMRLKDTEGKWHELNKTPSDYTVLVFWAPDCGHCKKAMPDLKDFYEAYKDKGVDFWGISTSQDTKEWRDFIEEKKLDWRNVTDNPTDPFLNDFRKVYDVFSTPRVFVLDKNKIIKAKGIGAEQLPEVIDRIMKEDAKP